MPIKWKYCITLLTVFILGFEIYHRSSLPPYGHPINELSDNYWGVITDIAHRWRNFDFSFWNMELGGGMSLFTSGEYPLLNPTNFLAWFLNDDVFYKVKLIEPYVLGYFFMMILLWDVFKTRWYVACFGGLAYIGLTFAKATTMAESPYFLYGCGLFPGMVFVAMKLFQKHVYLAAAGVGAFLALQFLGEGVTQVPQLIIWWTIFFTIYLMHEGFSLTTIKKGFLTILILVGTTVGLSAVQIVPTAHFFHYESARLVGGNYPINNFMIFTDNPRGYLFHYMWAALMAAGPIRTKGVLVLVLVCLALSCVHFGRIFARAHYKSFIYQAWSAIIIYFLVPPMAGLIVQVWPFLKGLFNFMTFFSFRYGLHILDFCMVLSLCLILNDDQLSFRIEKNDWVRGGLGIVFLVLAVCVCLVPCLVFLSPGFAKWFTLSPYFMLPNLQYGLRFLFKSLALIFLIVVRPARKIFYLALIILLIGMGFMMLLDCFRWYEKGSRTHPELYQLTSPEHEYYAQAKGKYIIPYISTEPQWVIHNYNMLYGVHGTCGSMALAPLRINKFEFYYNNRFHKDIATMPFQGNDAIFLGIDGPLPPSFTTYFPIDFTIINKSRFLSWEGFVKVVSGDKYDVYQRASPTPQVYFSNRLQIVPLPELVRKFDEPRSDAVYVASEDARALGLSPVSLVSETAQAHYRNYNVKKEDHLTFEVMADKDIFVIVPQRFEAGWKVMVDGIKVRTFPADYLFLGFRVQGGHHAVKLRYVPPGFWMGAVVNILSIMGVIFLFRRFYLP